MKNKKETELIIEEGRKKDLVKKIQKDFERRKEERLEFEKKWKENLDFLEGNHYGQANKKFFWEEREVFNHIAPIVETRLSKLSRVRPNLTVVPASEAEKDVASAKLTARILKALNSKLNMDKIIAEATKVSEIFGTSFYKVTWNNFKGLEVASINDGTKINAGDVDISVIPPYEIYPEDINNSGIESQHSIMHARMFHIDEIEKAFNIKVKGGAEGKDEFSIVIEKYELPSLVYPNGRLVIVCEDNLVYEGDLPYDNGIEGNRTYPFIRQVSVENYGNFFGSTVIERCIPVQRAFNAVKNRKHEFLNRLTMGILKVEDGSIDVESLEEEGLCPGKVLVYRKGSTPPSLLSDDKLPAAFSEEEQLLLNEFVLISGISDIMQNSKTLASGNLSGSALSLLIEQDDIRLNPTSDQIRFAALEIAKQSLRLYKQFASVPRLMKLAKGEEIEMIYFSGADITTDDVSFEDKE